MTIKNVALIGANGRLGPAILNVLLAANSLDVTVLSRSSSKSTYPESVKVAHISDDPSLEELVHALRGQDACVVTFAGSNSKLQILLADAAAEAGVQRFIPADFGSCDSSSPRVLELMTLYHEKQKVQQHLRKLSLSSNLSWTSLVCRHFFDYGLKSGLLQFDINARKVRIFDKGETRWSATILKTIGLAVVRVLQREEETKNRVLYVQSFSITQNQVLKSLEKVMGQKWQVEHTDSEKYIREMKLEADRDPNDDEARENLVSVMGIVEANWEEKDDFANSILGLENEDLDEAIRKIVQY